MIKMANAIPVIIVNENGIPVVVTNVGSGGGTGGGTIPFLLQLRREGLTNTIADANTLDLTALFNLSTDVQRIANVPITEYSMEMGALKLPNLNRYVGYSFTYTLTGSIGGGANSAREFRMELQRANGIFIRSSPVIKAANNLLEGRGTAINTYTFDSTDPFITDGFRMVLNNISGQTIQITSVNLLIQAT